MSGNIPKVAQQYVNKTGSQTTIAKAISNTKINSVVRVAKERMSLFTALFYFGQACGKVDNKKNERLQLFSMVSMKEEFKMDDSENKRFEDLSKNGFIKSAFKEGVLDSEKNSFKTTELTISPIDDLNNPDPNILLEVLKKIKEVERQLFYVFTHKDFEKQETESKSYDKLFKSVEKIINEQYFEKRNDKTIKDFYKKSENDKCCSYFTAVYVRIELMRRSFASKFGTNLLLFCPLKVIENDTKHKELIENLYTTTSRRGDGGEGFYGGLVDTIKFNQRAFYEVVDSLKALTTHNAQLTQVVNDFLEETNEKKKDELTKQIEVAVQETVQNVQNRLRAENDYDLKIWNHLNVYGSERDILMEFLINYAKYFLFKDKNSELANKAKSYFTKIDSFNIKDGEILYKNDINLKEDLFGEISQDVMVKIVKTCLNACNRETIEEISEGANTEAYTKYNEYVKLFDPYIQKHMSVQTEEVKYNKPERLIVAGFAKTNDGKWVYTTEYKVSMEMDRTGHPYGLSHLPALTHPVMMTAFPDVKVDILQKAFYDLVRAYDKSWAKQNAGVLAAFEQYIDYVEERKDLNQNVMSELFRNYGCFGINLTDLKNRKELYKKALKYKIKKREEEFRSGLNEILSDQDQFNIYDSIWSKDEKDKIEQIDYFFTKEDEKEINDAVESTRNKFKSIEKALEEAIIKLNEKEIEKENEKAKNIIFALLKPDVKIGIGANGCVAEQGDLTPRSLPDVISLYGVLPKQMADDNKLTNILKLKDYKLQFTRTTSDVGCLRNKGLTLTYGINHFGIVISGIASVFHYINKASLKDKSNYRDIIVEAFRLGQRKVFEKGGRHLISLVAIAAEFEQYRGTSMTHDSLCQYVANQLNNAFRINDLKFVFEIDDVKHIEKELIKVYLEYLPVDLKFLSSQLKIEYLNDSLCLLKEPPSYIFEVKDFHFKFREVPLKNK